MKPLTGAKENDIRRHQCRWSVVARNTVIKESRRFVQEGTGDMMGSPDNAEGPQPLISSFNYDRDLEAWVFTGRENDLD